MQKMASYRMFCYGTLTSMELQMILFGGVKPMEPAVLPGHAIVADEDGYFYLRETPKSNVHGQLLRLTEKELEMVDTWEDVHRSLYERQTIQVEVEVEPQGGTNQLSRTEMVYTYMKVNPQAAHSIQIGTISNHPLQDVLEMARQLRLEEDDSSE
ncbi:gamma-glutamylcyclotransferase family protein [Paenibacillus sp. WLX1005]|uniref:gamma-glutamylcyclotransferase family protein n=1 Tax=unclassified Paenibacillus TaxID=185978 RepID=UPI003983FE33